MCRLRFVSPWRRARRILGLNARNLMYIQPLTPRALYPLADDKILTKKVLQKAGVPTPEVLAILGNLADVSDVRAYLELTREFVIKPARGRQGGGIIVVLDCENGEFVRSGGERIDWESLRRMMGDILFGVYSVGHSDRVLIERRVRPHPGIGPLGQFGLPDIRVILIYGQPVMAMMRVPTTASRGRANLHQGAVGIGIRIDDGSAYRAVLGRKVICTHPEHHVALTGWRVPLWDEVLRVSCQASRAVGIPYLGVDVVLDAGAGPQVMEVNARPGLEIQNVNGIGLRRRLECKVRAGWVQL